MAFSGNTARVQGAITPSDTAENKYSAIYVGAAGVVTVISLAGDSVAWTCAAGFIIPAHCSKVMSTGTTATLLIGLNN